MTHCILHITRIFTLHLHVSLERFRRDKFYLDTKYLVAMKAEDEAINASPLSNIQEIFIPSSFSILS